MNMNRRQMSYAALLGAVGTVLGWDRVAAQLTTQEVRNGAQVTATGDVRLEQSASGNQEVGVVIDGTVVTEDGIYNTSTGQVVINEGQVTATGDVDVVQSASGNQEVTVSRAVYDGAPASRCNPGAVMADPHGVLYFQRDDCCWYLVPCIPCKRKGCEGDYCG